MEDLELLHELGKGGYARQEASALCTEAYGCY